MHSKILKTGSMEFQMKVLSPYIISFHHKDLFPVGKEDLSPISYKDRWVRGNDFDEEASWRMYHGGKIPGFPQHPHRGFETITVVTEGFVDHADGLGAAGRYGNGDVQWMTAGSGLTHAEMFPLLDTTKENPMELFQIWLNLPAKSKFVPPYYRMLWNEEIPVFQEKDTQGRQVNFRLINGKYKEHRFYKANPDSWAATPDNCVNIMLIKADPKAVFDLPPTEAGTNRMFYFYEGDTAHLFEKEFDQKTWFELAPEETIPITNGDREGYFLLLDGKPIQEPVVAYGPFVMNTREEIVQAYEDYERTEFGGWPWSVSGPVHEKNSGRFASYKDNQREYPPQK